MRFAIGLLLGFGAGLAGAILFAPDSSKRSEAGWTAATASDNSAENGNSISGLRGALRSLQDQINTAMSEAKQASDEAEQEMRGRYEEAVGRKDGDKK